MFTTYKGMESLPNNSEAASNQHAPSAVVVDDKPMDLNATNEKKEEVKTPVSDINDGKDNTTSTEALHMGEEVYTSTGASLGSSVVNMMNTIVGAGTLSLPCTIMDGGPAGAGLLLIISPTLS